MAIKKVLIRKKKTYRKKRSMKSKIRRYTKRIFRRMPLNGFPNHYYSINKYVDHITINPPLIPLHNIHVFTANDIYDPDNTGVGHQPMGTDHLFNVYASACVIGSKIRVTPVVPNGDSTPFYLWVYKSNKAVIDSELIDNYGYFENAQMQKYKMFGNYTTKQFNNSVTCRFSFKKWFKESSEGTEYQCSSTTSPAERCYYKIICSSVPTDGDPPLVTFRVELFYIVHWTERRITVTS